MTSTNRRLPLLVAAAATVLFAADGAWAQQRQPAAGATILEVTGGGTGNPEMRDHAGMGGAGVPSAVQGVGPVTGGGAGDAEMDHSRMGTLQASGGGASVGQVTGGGTGDAEMAHRPGVGAPRS